MDELNRYWTSEYVDPDFRRHQAGQASGTRDTDSMVLARGAIRSWTIGFRPSVLVCQKGTLWLTRSNHSDDLIVKAGDSVVLTTGLWVAEALEPARIHRGPFQPTKEARHGQKSLFSLFRWLRGPEFRRA